MSKKLYILGIDGLSYDFIFNNLEHLPGFSKLFKEGKCKVLKSIFPPDSIPAWVTIYTGLSPAEHGVLGSIDYIKPSNNNTIPAMTSYKGKTFWDVISNSNKKVCIINPFLAFPVWNVNGFFINGSVFSQNKQIDANDPILLKKYPPPNLGGLTSFPTKDELPNFINDSVYESKQLAEYASLIHNHDNYDLFFITYLTMDRFQHFMWRYSDLGDITHPKNNEFKDSILNFYQHFDVIVSDVINGLKKDESLVIISDHGHGRRCTNVLNINEILRKHGYFFTNTKKIKLFDKGYLLEKFKNFTMKIVYRFDLEDFFYKLAKFIPNRSAIKKGKHLKSSKNIAEACDMFGTNPFGGIKINKQNIPPNIEYEAIREDIINIFSNYKYNNKSLFCWIKKREEIMTGIHKDKFADILFEMDSEFGVNWALFTKEVDYNTTHKKISGGHDSNGCFFTYNLDQESFDRVNTVKDLFMFTTSYFQ